MNKPYIVITTCDGEFWEEDANTLEDAVKIADANWHHLTDAEKKTHIIYVLKSNNPDTDADDHYDGEQVYYATRYGIHGRPFRINKTYEYDALTSESKDQVQNTLLEILDDLSCDSAEDKEYYELMSNSIIAREEKLKSCTLIADSTEYLMVLL